MGDDASSSSWPSTGAAAAYDYERDPRWAEYRASSAVLPHLFSHPYVRAQLQQKFYRRFVVRTTPLHHAAVLSSLCSPSSLRSAFRIGRACVPAVPSASHCPSACTAALARGFSRSGHLARLLSSLRPARPLEFPSFLFHHKKKESKNKEESWSNGWNHPFCDPAPELSEITGCPGAAAAAFGWMMMPRGATWPSQRIINGLHYQGNFRGGIEIVVGEAGRGRGREGRQGGVSRLPLSPCCAFASESCQV